MSVAHDCSFVLDARLQSGDLVQDAKGGVRFGRKRATVKAGAPSFDLNESLLERDAGPLTVIPQNYTHAYWVWWRHSDAGAYRTLLRGSDDHSCAVKGRELGCAPSNRNAWPPNSPRRASQPRAAGLSPFRRYFCTRDGDTGGQFHSTGFSIRARAPAAHQSHSRSTAARRCTALPPRRRPPSPTGRCTSRRARAAARRCAAARAWMRPARLARHQSPIRPAACCLRARPPCPCGSCHRLLAAAARQSSRLMRMRRVGRLGAQRARSPRETFGNAGKQRPSVRA